MATARPAMIVDKTSVWLNHALLALVAGGVIWLLGKIIEKGGEGWDAAAFLLVLQSVLSVIRNGQTSTSIDRATEKLGESVPGKPVLLQKPEDFHDSAPLPERKIGDFDAYRHFEPEAEPEQEFAPADVTEAADAIVEAASEKRDEIVGKE